MSIDQYFNSVLSVSHTLEFRLMLACNPSLKKMFDNCDEPDLRELSSPQGNKHWLICLYFYELRNLLPKVALKSPLIMATYVHRMVDYGIENAGGSLLQAVDHWNVSGRDLENLKSQLDDRFVDSVMGPKEKKEV